MTEFLPVIIRVDYLVIRVNSFILPNVKADARASAFLLVMQHPYCIFFSHLLSDVAEAAGQNGALLPQ